MFAIGYSADVGCEVVKVITAKPASASQVGYLLTSLAVKDSGPCTECRMDDQRTFFQAFEQADVSLSRSSDPRTSRLAEPTQGQRLTLHQIALAVLANSTPLTANELAERCASHHLNVAGARSDSFRKRMAELVRSGQVEVAGERQCRVTGKVATVYRSHS